MMGFQAFDKRLLAGVVAVVLASVTAFSQQSTTGPEPPKGIDRGLRPPDRTQRVIPDVPRYFWHHGCGPTAAGMVIGFWDANGYPDLIEGDASTFTFEVSQAIATDNIGTCDSTGLDHYGDYACPFDAAPGPIQPDCSETGGTHANNCLADFMYTSRSAFYNYYGWSWFSDDGRALRDYVLYKLPDANPVVETIEYNDFSWEEFKAEIDARRPLILLVDTGNDGITDHFVTAIGYDDVKQEYACLDTWDSNVHWYEWHRIRQNDPWGIYGVTTLALDVVCSDADGDGLGDPGVPGNTCATDNCPGVFNPNQDDIDGDGLGDLCDPDMDGDGIDNEFDNCPTVATADQTDSDADGVGDPCDNCVGTQNPLQRDQNEDGIGDMCDGNVWIYPFPHNIPEAYLNTEFEFQFEGVGGSPPYVWSQYGGDLPYGLALDSQSGMIYGSATWKATYYFTIKLEDSSDPPISCLVDFTIVVVDPPDPQPGCGDADGSLSISVGDAVFLINYIFGGGAAPDPISLGDADCSGAISIGDAVYLIAYIFGGGPAPCASCPE